MTNLLNLTNVEVHDALDASGYHKMAFDNVEFTHKYVNDKGTEVFAYAVTWIDDDGISNVGAVYVWEKDGALFADF